MEQRRQYTQAANVEEQSHEPHGECDYDDNHVSALETLGGHRHMGHWELSHVSSHHVPAMAKRVQKSPDMIMENLIAKNPFHALSDEEDEMQATNVPELPTTPVLANPIRRTWKVKTRPTSTESGMTTSASLSEYPWLTKVAQGARKKWKRRMSIMPTIVETAELNNVGTDRDLGVSRTDGKRVELTIDSGAAEHVVGPQDLPHIPIGTSRKHVQYTMANGQKTSNKGEKHAQAVARDGHEIAFKAQVTDVHRPLMSVSRICDKGHRVVFESHGGYIESLTTGEKINVHRDHNVYRLQVEVPKSGFTRQGVDRSTHL